jgi:hypothetical protein
MEPIPEWLLKKHYKNKKLRIESILTIQRARTIASKGICRANTVAISSHHPERLYQGSALCPSLGPDDSDGKVCVNGQFYPIVAD